jgi:hypothetical protein
MDSKCISVAARPVSKEDGTHIDASNEYKTEILLVALSLQLLLVSPFGMSMLSE